MSTSKLHQICITEILFERCKETKESAHIIFCHFQTSGRSIPAGISDVRVRDRSHAGLSVAGAAFLGLMSDDSSEGSSSESAEHSDYEPAVKHSVTADAARELPIRMRKTPVEKVKHGAGYNYGVPGK